MNLYFRKSWWWLTPLVLVLTVLGIYWSLLYRRNTQARIAEQIVALGGSVDVRCEAPGWLFHFASDNCRKRFRESQGIESWGDKWPGRIVISMAVDRLIFACDVADQVHVRVTTESQLEFERTSPDKVPRLIELISRLDNLRTVEIRSWFPCHLDLKTLPRSVESLQLMLPMSAGSDESVDTGSLPPGLTELLIYDLSLDNQTLEQIARCTRLRSLALGRTPVNDQQMRSLLSLTRLESLEVVCPEFTDASLHTLNEFPNLKRGRLFVRDPSAATLDQIKASIPDLRFEDLNEMELQVLALRTFRISRGTGFDRLVLLLLFDDWCESQIARRSSVIPQPGDLSKQSERPIGTRGQSQASAPLANE